MSELTKRFRKLVGTRSDIMEHLGLLHGLAADPEVRVIVEFGFRTGVSATALCLSGKPVISYDIEKCQPHVDVLKRLAPKFEFRHGSSTKGVTDYCDLLFIDSLHTYDQLLAELMSQHVRVSKWIAMHDTTKFGDEGQDGKKPGLTAAIETFLRKNPTWKIQLHLSNNNGMTLLERSTAR